MLRAYRACCTHARTTAAPAAWCWSGCWPPASVAFGFVPPGFMPDSARPQFVVDLYLPQGTDIDTTAEVVAAAEAGARQAGVTHVTSFIGQGGCASC
jgi:multidrug efflux pump subunit AcrB